MALTQGDFSRQVNIFNPEEFKTPVHIIGAGATGSWLAFSLAKMGIQNLHIYDFDEVGMHNLPNQLFGLRDIEQNKAGAIRQAIRRYTGYRVDAKNVKIDGSQPMQGIVFMLTDTMASRKKIYEMAIKNNPNIELLIETRMDLRGGRIYALDPRDKTLTEQYEQTLYSDDESEVSACGVSQTVLPTAIGIVSNAIWKLLNYINEEEFAHETLVDFSNEIIMTTYWKKVEKIRTKITKEDLLGKKIICRSEDESNNLMMIYENAGIVWAGGAVPTSSNKWGYNMYTYYVASDGDEKLRYGTFKEEKYTPENGIEFSDFIRG